MLKTLFITLCITLTAIIPTMAQDDWQRIYEELLEEGGEETTAAQQELLFEELSHLYAHPLNINTATAEELGKLPFLNPSHIQAIHRYIQYNGELLSTGELLLIDSIDYHTRHLLRHFVYTAPISKDEPASKRLTLDNLLKYGTHEFLCRTLHFISLQEIASRTIYLQPVERVGIPRFHIVAIPRISTIRMRLHEYDAVIVAKFI